MLKASQLTEKSACSLLGIGACSNPLLVHPANVVLRRTKAEQDWSYQRNYISSIVALAGQKNGYNLTLHQAGRVVEANVTEVHEVG